MSLHLLPALIHLRKPRTIFMQRFIITWRGKHHSQCHSTTSPELLILLLDTTAFFPLLLILREATVFNLIHPEAMTESAADIQLVLVRTPNYCFVKNVNILTFVAILRVERNCIFVWKFWNVTLNSQIQLWISEFHILFHFALAFSLFNSLNAKVEYFKSPLLILLWFALFEHIKTMGSHCPALTETKLQSLFFTASKFHPLKIFDTWLLWRHLGESIKFWVRRHFGGGKQCKASCLPFSTSQKQH